MKDLPIECCDDEVFESWKATAGYEAALETLAEIRRRQVRDLIEYSKSMHPDDASIGWAIKCGARIAQVEEIISYFKGETRDAQGTSKEP